MKYIKNVCFLLLLAVLSGCSFQNNTQSEQPYQVQPYKQNVIALENLKTRIIAYCYASQDFSAEDCAHDLEQKGFVRLKDVPRVTADKDFLTTGTYPTRRWRETDVIPRW